jgi:hypothetical protein
MRKSLLMESFYKKTLGCLILAFLLLLPLAKADTYSWWNSSYSYRRQEQINQTGSSTLINFPYLINGTGFNLSTEPTQYVWTIANISADNTTFNYLYYNDFTNYAVVNGSDNVQLPFEVERGNGTSYNPTQVWDSNYWYVHHFWNGAGTVVNDSTKNGYNGTFASRGGGSLPAWVSNGKFGYALFFNGAGTSTGASSYVDLGFNITGGITSQMTVEAWVNFADRTKMGCIVCRSGTDVGGNRKYELWNGGDGSFMCQFTNATGTDFAATATGVFTQNNVWYYVVCTYNGTHLMNYVNGNLAAIVAMTGNLKNPTSTSITDRIGASGTGASGQAYGVNAVIDEVRISNVSRSADYIKRQWEMGLARLGAEQTANTPPVVDTPKTYDENLNEKTEFEVNQKVVIRANVTDAQGAGDISNVLLTLIKPDSTVLGNFTMVNISSTTNGYVYEYNYTPDINGTWQVKVFANDTQNAWASNSTTFVAYLNMTISNVSEVKSFQPTNFIQVNGTDLTLGGQPYRFVGMNSYYLVDYATNFTYDDDGNPIYNSRQYVLEVLNEMHYLNLNVLRTWGGMECGYAGHSYSVWDCNNSGGHYNAFQKYTHGNWSEEMYQALDWLIYEAGKRDIRIALVLVNNWNEYGGMRWYVQQSPTTNKTWENITDDNDPRYWEFHDQFYSDANAKQYFKDFINHTLWRNNTYTGRYYKDDPTIAMWVLANEPRAKSQGSNYTLIRNWTQEMADYIRSIDTNHIIALGMEGWGDPWEGTAFINNQNLGNLSIATYNINPYQWDWFAQRSEYATDLDWADEGWNTTKVIDWWTNSTSLSYNNRYETDYVPNYNPNLGRHGYKDWVRQHVDWANVNLSKPIMAMEVLYPLRKGKVAVDGDEATYDLRVKFFNQTVKNFFDNGGDGLLFWVLQHDNYYWSTANSSYAGKMDDGFGFYVSDNATLRDSSKPVIDTLTWIRDSGYVNLLNDYKYNFNYKPEISGANPKNATLYLFINNENGTSYTVKITNTSEVKNKDLNAFTYQFQRAYNNSDKNFTYIIEVCSDNPALGCTNTTQSNTIIILTAKPAITLNSPAEKRYPSLTQVFNYTVTGDLDITYCQLFINGTANKTSTTVNKDTPQTFVVTFDREGSYEWYVECSDAQSNLGDSPKRTLVIGSPKWSNNSSYAPTTYNYNTLSIFNITWNDSLGYSIDTVLFESNYSGMPKNYTMTLIDPYINETERKGVYSFSDTLPAGTFYWKSYAKASDGTWNATDTWYFAIDKATPALTLTVYPSWSIFYPAETNVTGSESNLGDSDLTYNLYRNNVLVSNPDVATLAVGSYVYVYNTSGGQNYTANSVSNTLTVSAPPPVHGVPLLSSTLVGMVIGFGIIIFMLRTFFDIREPKKVIEYFIVLAVIVLTVISLIVLFA